MGGKNGIVLPALHHVYVEEVQLAQGPLYRSGRAGGDEALQTEQMQQKHRKVMAYQ